MAEPSLTSVQEPVPYYQHPGYSMVDHQLDRLLEVIRSWAYDHPGVYGGYPAQSPDLERAALAVGACRAALNHLLVQMREDVSQRAYEAERQRLHDAGEPDPLVEGCGYCDALEHEPCESWRDGRWRPLRGGRFHADRHRRAAAALAARSTS